MNGYLNIPGFGDGHWKAPVLNAASLPIVGSQPGDVRVTLDTFATYTFNGTTWLISSGGNAFGIIQTPYGTNPVADGHTDSLTFTSNDASVVITGDATTDTVDFSVNIPPSGVTSVTASSPLFSSGGSTPNITIQVANTSQNGYLSNTDWNVFNSKEPAITAGTTLQYWRGDKTFQTLNTSVVPELTNLYFTDARARLAISSTAPVDYNNISGIISMHVADSTHDGYLSSTDWSTFNSKANAFTPGSISTSTTGVTVGSGTNSTVGPNVTVNIATASTSLTGLLTSTDWNTFNNKQNALTFGNLTDVGTDGITITGGTGAVIGSGTSIAQQVADTTHNGYLSSTDWNTFNGKQAAGSYITALTGDVTASGPGSSAAAVKTNLKTASIGTTIDGGGFVITTGLKSFVTVPYNCTITAVTMLADVVGSIVVDIWKVNYAGFPGSVANTITSATPPTISAAQKSTDSTLSGWTTSVSAGDILEFNVNSASTITKVNLVLTVVKT